MEYSSQVDELMSKCVVTCKSVEGHEKLTQEEMYERPADVKITSNQVLRPECYKELIKVSHCMLIILDDTKSYVQKNNLVYEFEFNLKRDRRFCSR